MKTAIVTGALGFVGRHLIPELVRQGYFVKAIDNAIRDDLSGIDNIECFLGSNADIKNPDWHDFFCKRHAYGQVDLFVHLAANIVNVDKRMKMGVEAFDDLILDYSVCKWVEKLMPQTFVAMSSCAVDFPDDPYCIIKRNLEAMAKTLHKNGQQTVILRPFSGYGIDQSDEYPFPSIMKRAIRKEDPLVVWGGAQQRDWLHVDDLVNGIIYGSQRFPSGEPVELGTCHSVSFFKLASKIADVVGYKTNIVGDNNKPTSSMFRCAGLSHTAIVGQVFGWSPKISLEEGIKLEYGKFLSKCS